ncbi:MAG TPA: Hsp20/alpha crystallin family protein [Planctomycetaceae bacterium]|nr:Hsp20/alpha crystallin family protein [Planctomycetaceae bacterium]
MSETCRTDNQVRRVVYKPSVKILESTDGLELIAEVPGADQNSTEVVVEKDTLVVRARVSVSPPADGQRVVYADHRDGDYERTFQLSQEIDRTRIEAQVKDGVLRVRLPKSQQAQPQKITVLAG